MAPFCWLALLHNWSTLHHASLHKTTCTSTWELQYHPAANYLQDHGKPQLLSRGRGGGRNSYCCIGASKSTVQLLLHCRRYYLHLTTPWQLVLVFSKSQIYCAIRTSYLHTPTIGTQSFDLSSAHSPITRLNYLPHIRPTAVSQGKRFCSYN